MSLYARIYLGTGHPNCSGRKRKGERRADTIGGFQPLLVSHRRVPWGSRGGEDRDARSRNETGRGHTRVSLFQGTAQDSENARGRCVSGI